MNKDHINAKISEALSASFGEDWEKEFDDLYNYSETWPPKKDEKGIRYNADKSELKEFIRKEKEKRESEIKSALETIDWSDVMEEDKLLRSFEGLSDCCSARVYETSNLNAEGKCSKCGNFCKIKTLPS